MTPSRRLMVTGAHGFVAGSVIAQAGPVWELHAVSRQEAITRQAGLHWHRLDPLDPEALARLFHDVRPDVVLHTAALADIDFCETHPELARLVNVDLTRRLADLCATAGARLIFCSSDTVFDGERAPYREDDAPGPVNLYARTKVEAERIVSRSGPRAVIARLALVVGLPVLGAGNSFLARMMASLRAGREVSVPAHEVRSPVDVITAGRALLELAAGVGPGFYHLAGDSRLNRFEMARRIAARFGLPTHRVVAQSPTSVSSRAPRPRDVSLDNAKARAELRTPMLSLDEGLSLVLESPHTAEV